MDEKKYELTNETVLLDSGIKLYRIRSLRNFSCVRKDDLGGFVEKEDNLSQYDNARVYGDARVYGNAEVYGNAWVCGDAKVYGNADYIVFKNFWSSGRYFTWTRSNDKYKVGCFYGSGEELVNKAFCGFGAVWAVV